LKAAGVIQWAHRSIATPPRLRREPSRRLLNHGAKREQRLLAGFARDETKLGRKTVRHDHLYIGRSKEGIQISITKDIAMPRTTTLPTIPLCGPSGNPASQRGA